MIATAVVVLDQIVKAMIGAWIGPDQTRHRFEILGRWIAVEYAENTGAAFGILAGQTMLLSALAIVVTVVFLYSMRHEVASNRVLLVAVGIVLGGALGNLVDRIRLGYVVDFIAVGIWPRFNLADSSIVVGLSLMAFVALTTDDSDIPDGGTDAQHVTGRSDGKENGDSAEA